MKVILAVLASILVIASCNGAATAPPTVVAPTVAPPSPTAASQPTVAPVSPTVAATPSAASGKAINVLYAGSLVNLMEKGIGPAFQKESGVAYQGQGAGSVALANAIHDKTKTGDVFISADPAVNRTLMGADRGDWVSWYVVFARTSMVIGYSAKSKFAADFEKVKNGTMPWYQVLEEPGLRLGRTDPNLDPKGYRTLFLFELAQDFYKAPDLGQKIVGVDANPDQIFPEETLETRLESGALDAGIFYLNEAVEKKLPYISLPDEINLSNPDLAAAYAKVSFTNAKGQAFKGGPIVYTATVLNRAKDAPDATTFVVYLLSAAGQGIMKDHGLLSTPALAGGDKATLPTSVQPLVKGDYTG
jgi:molybdate/tungstate transport system substrate-binding protein